MASIEREDTTTGERRYVVRWRLHGKSKEKSFRRRADAESWKRKVEGDELSGILIDQRADDIRLKAYTEEWLRTRLVKGRPLAPKTVQGYQDVLRRVVYPTLGETPIQAITPELVRSWYADVTAARGHDQIAKAYRILRAVLNTAVADDRIARNPCRIKGAGTEHPAERPMLDSAEVLALAETIDPRFRAMVLLAGFGGLRTGESLGLVRSDVDLVNGTVLVDRQALELKGEGRIVTSPKSEAGRRTVALPTIVTEALAAHLEAHCDPEPDAWVFVGPTGLPVARARVSAAWQAALTKLGAPNHLRLHDLRHHAATLAARMPGITTKELMARIGHASPRAALIYQHATTERDRSIAEFLNAQVTTTIERLQTPPDGQNRGAGVGLASGGDSPENQENAPDQEEHLEAATGIEPVCTALQAVA
jgi:integrase